MAEKNQLIYVDTCVFLDYVAENKTLHPETGEERWISAEKLLKAVENGRVRLASSALIEAEVLVAGPVRTGTSDVQHDVQRWLRSPDAVWTDIDRLLAREAARIKAEWHAHRADNRKDLGTADALHLAAAIRMSCDYLMTQDQAFPIGHDVEGVKVRYPDVVWPDVLIDVTK